MHVPPSHSTIRLRRSHQKSGEAVYTALAVRRMCLLDASRVPITSGEEPYPPVRSAGAADSNHGTSLGALQWV